MWRGVAWRGVVWCGAVRRGVAVCVAVCVACVRVCVCACFVFCVLCVVCCCSPDVSAWKSGLRSADGFHAQSVDGTVKIAIGVRQRDVETPLDPWRLTAGPRRP